MGGGTRNREGDEQKAYPNDLQLGGLRLGFSLAKRAHTHTHAHTPLIIAK